MSTRSLESLYEQALEEAQKRIKYDMVNVNGGFSDGVDIRPGTNAGLLAISVDIYGGGTKNSMMYNVPQKIAEYQAAYVEARRTGDSVAPDLNRELQSYYKNLKKAISIEAVRLISQFDQEMKVVVDKAVANMNKRYGTPQQPEAAPTTTVKPKPQPPQPKQVQTTPPVAPPKKTNKV